jgi:hypothetical protein
LAERIEDVNVRRASQLRVLALVAYYSSDWHMTIKKVFAQNVARMQERIVHCPSADVVAVYSPCIIALANDLHNIATLWFWVFWVCFWAAHRFSRPANINASKIKPNRKVISLLGVDGHYPSADINQFFDAAQRVIAGRRTCVAVSSNIVDRVLEQRVGANVLGLPCVYGHKFAALHSRYFTDISPRFAKAAALCVVTPREQ